MKIIMWNSIAVKHQKKKHRYSFYGWQWEKAFLSQAEEHNFSFFDLLFYSLWIFIIYLLRPKSNKNKLRVENTSTSHILTKEKCWTKVKQGLVQRLSIIINRVVFGAEQNFHFVERVLMSNINFLMKNLFLI